MIKAHNYKLTLLEPKLCFSQCLKSLFHTSLCSAGMSSGEELWAHFTAINNLKVNNGLYCLSVYLNICSLFHPPTCRLLLICVSGHGWGGKQRIRDLKWQADDLPGEEEEQEPEPGGQDEAVVSWRPCRRGGQGLWLDSQLFRYEAYNHHATWIISNVLNFCTLPTVPIDHSPQSFKACSRPLTNPLKLHVH